MCFALAGIRELTTRVPDVLAVTELMTPRKSLPPRCPGQIETPGLGQILVARIAEVTAEPDSRTQAAAVGEIQRAVVHHIKIGCGE